MCRKPFFCSFGAQVFSFHTVARHLFFYVIEIVFVNFLVASVAQVPWSAEVRPMGLCTFFWWPCGEPALSKKDSSGLRTRVFDRATHSAEDDNEYIIEKDDVDMEVADEVDEVDIDDSNEADNDGIDGGPLPILPMSPMSSSSAMSNHDGDMKFSSE